MKIQQIVIAGIICCWGIFPVNVSAQSPQIVIVQNAAEDLFNSGLAKSEAGDIQGSVSLLR